MDRLLPGAIGTWVATVVPRKISSEARSRGVETCEVFALQPALLHLCWFGRVPSSSILPGAQTFDALLVFETAV